MFGLSPQKVDGKALIATIDTDLDKSNDSLEALIAETGKSRQELLEACLADDEVESCREDLRAAMMAQPWRIWGEDVDETIINRLYRMLNQHLETFVDVAVLARFNGYAVAEYIYHQEADGFWTIAQVLNKDGELDRYNPKRDGNVLLTADSGEIVLDQKMKYLVLRSKVVPARPAGEMMILRAYPAVVLRKRGLAYAGQFVKRYAQPYIIGKQGGFGALNEFVSKLFGFSNGGAAAIGKDDEISMHQLSGNGEAFRLIEKLANARIQKLLLGRVKTGDLDNGSRAAQETEENTRIDRISAYLDLLARAIQHALDAVIAVNAQYGRPLHAPQGLWFEHQKPDSIDLKRAQRDQIYLQSGALSLNGDYFREICGYEEGHFSAGAMAQTSLALSAPKPTPFDAQGLALADNQQSAGQHAPHIRELEESQAEQLMSGKVKALQAVLDKVENYHEFEAALAALVLPDNGLTADLAAQAASSRQQGLGA